MPKAETMKLVDRLCEYLNEHACTSPMRLLDSRRTELAEMIEATLSEQQPEINPITKDFVEHSLASNVAHVMDHISHLVGMVTMEYLRDPERFHRRAEALQKEYSDRTADNNQKGRDDAKTRDDNPG